LAVLLSSTATVPRAASARDAKEGKQTMNLQTGSGAQGAASFFTVSEAGFYLLALAAAVSTPIPAGAAVRFDVTSPALTSGVDGTCSAVQSQVARTKSSWVYLRPGDVIDFGVSLSGTHPTPPDWTCELYVYRSTDLA
jgi:hypothetical protein